MKKTKILIVEDEAIIAMEIENQLQSLGYQVTSIVDTGEKAVKKAEEDKPNLILMDIRIKGELDGIDTAEEIRNKFGIPVIFSTAYLDEERIERAKITKPFGYVLKPIQERDLKVTIEMALYVSRIDMDLRDNEERYRNLFNNMSSGCGIYKVTNGKEFVLIDYNCSGEKMDGLKREHIIGKNIADLFPDPERLLNASNILRQVWKTGKSERLLASSYKVGDNEVWRENYIYKLKSGEIVVIFDDITERKRAEEALKKSEEWFYTTLKSIGDAVITTDTKGYVTLLNPVAETLTGWKQEDAKGKPLIEVFNIINETTRKPVENPVEKVLKTGKIVGLANHTVLISMDGSEISIDDSASPIKNDKGEVFGVVLVFREIVKNR